MEIVRPINHTVNFGEIKPGQCFNFEGDFYIKAIRAADINTMAVKTGALSFFADYEQVVPVVANFCIF